jgi:hypothetical protein
MILLEELQKVENFAKENKLKKIISSPVKYKNILFSRHLFKSKIGVLKLTKTFWGDSIRVVLPASTDIYLSGGKTHSSELRLTKYLINNIQETDTVLDIGAHVGYFTLLISTLAKKAKCMRLKHLQKHLICSN